MYPLLSERMNIMMKRWKAIGELQKEGVIPKGSPNYSSIVSKKCVKLQRTDDVNALKEINTILDENIFLTTSSKKNNL